jgi:hypothetical protein
VDSFDHKKWFDRCNLVDVRSDVETRNIDIHVNIAMERFPGYIKMLLLLPLQADAVDKMNLTNSNEKNENVTVSHI